MERKKDKLGRNAPTNYSESFKRRVIEEYLLTGIPKLHLQEKHGIKFKSGIATWIKTLGYLDVHRNISNLATIKDTDLPKKPQCPKSISTEQALELEIKRLKQQLEDERLRTEMLNRMVDLAEKTYKIPVRKNSNTK
jgi:transposase